MKTIQMYLYADGQLNLVTGTRIPGNTTRIKVNCSSGKDAYPTYEDAMRAFRLKNGTGRREKRIYKCHECGFWHFTTNQATLKANSYSRSKDKKEVERIIRNSLRAESWIFTTNSLRQEQWTTIQTPSRYARTSSIKMMRKNAEW